jgi:ribokinase
MKVLNYGSLNIDYVYYVDHFVRAGETLDSQKLELFCGGKGLNQSIALRNSGANVWHAGAVGETDSDMLLELLNKSGVNTEFIRKKSGASGHAIIQKATSGENCILLYGGANQRITREEVDETLLQFDKGDFLVLQNEISEIDYIMKRAHAKGMRIVFNPSPMNSKIPTYPLDQVDFLILNEVEGMEISGCREANENLIERLGELYPKAKIILTLGEKGSLYKYNEVLLHQSIYKVEAVDTTAAGDTFTGFFIGAIINGELEEKALDNAAKASAITVTREGAGSSIPAKDEVDSFHIREKNSVN